MSDDDYDDSDCGFDLGIPSVSTTAAAPSTRATASSLEDPEAALEAERNATLAAHKAAQQMLGRQGTTSVQLPRSRSAISLSSPAAASTPKGPSLHERFAKHIVRHLRPYNIYNV